MSEINQLFIEHLQLVGTNVSALLQNENAKDRDGLLHCHRLVCKLLEEVAQAPALEHDSLFIPVINQLRHLSSLGPAIGDNSQELTEFITHLSLGLLSAVGYMHYLKQIRDYQDLPALLSSTYRALLDQQSPGDISLSQLQTALHHYLRGLMLSLQADFALIDTVTTPSLSLTGKHWEVTPLQDPNSPNTNATSSRQSQWPDKIVPQPGLRLWGPNRSIYGYVFIVPPVGDWWKSLGLEEIDELLPGAFSNLIVTNFFVYHYYRDGSLSSHYSPMPYPHTNKQLSSLYPGSIPCFGGRIFDDFLQYSPGVYKNAVTLQKALATKIHYFAHGVLNRELRQGPENGKPNFLHGLYVQYIHFFKHRLNYDDFPLFLAHLTLHALLKCYCQSNLEPATDAMPVELETVASKVMNQSTPLGSLQYYQYLFFSPPPAVHYLVDELNLTMTRYPALPNLSEKVFWQEWKKHYFQPYSSPAQQERILDSLQQEGIPVRSLSAGSSGPQGSTG